MAVHKAARTTNTRIRTRSPPMSSYARTLSGAPPTISGSINYPQRCLDFSVCVTYSANC